jgi:hypothetical protein
VVSGGGQKPFEHNSFKKNRSLGEYMSTLEIILIVITFVIPALFILLDNGLWSRKGD